MANLQINLVINAVEQLLELVQPDREAEALAISKLLKRALGVRLDGEPETIRGRGRPSRGVTFIVGDYGYAVCDDYNQAAEYLGINAGSLHCRLSNGGGKAHYLFQDPDTHNPMDVVVTRGKIGEHSAEAERILAKAPRVTSKARRLGHKKTRR